MSCSCLRQTLTNVRLFYEQQEIRNKTIVSLQIPPYVEVVSFQKMHDRSHQSEQTKRTNTKLKYVTTTT